jgi:hypothetical protein
MKNEPEVKGRFPIAVSAATSVLTALVPLAAGWGGTTTRAGTAGTQSSNSPRALTTEWPEIATRLSKTAAARKFSGAVLIAFTSARSGSRSPPSRSRSLSTPASCRSTTRSGSISPASLPRSRTGSRSASCSRTPRGWATCSCAGTRLQQRSSTLPSSTRGSSGSRARTQAPPS